MHEALFVPAHTRAERWSLASSGTAPFPACTQAGGDSPPPAPSPASISRSHPGANRGCGAAAAPAPLRPSPPSAEGTRGLRVAAVLPGPAGPSCHLPAAGTGKPRAGRHRPGSGLRLPRHKEAWERERYVLFHVRHIKNADLAHHQRLGIWQDHGKRPASL